MSISAISVLCQRISECLNPSKREHQVVNLYPRSQASVAIREIADNLEKLLTIDIETDGIAALFKQHDMS